MKPQVTKKLLSGSNRSSLPRHDDARKDDNILAKGSDHTDVKAGEVSKTEDRNSSMKEPSTLSSASGESKRHWGRAHVSFLMRFPLALKCLVIVWSYMCTGEEKPFHGIY